MLYLEIGVGRSAWYVWIMYAFISLTLASIGRRGDLLRLVSNDLQQRYSAYQDALDSYQ